jgi:hypothetical protein
MCIGLRTWHACHSTITTLQHVACLLAPCNPATCQTARNSLWVPRGTTAVVAAADAEHGVASLPALNQPLFCVSMCTFLFSGRTPSLLTFAHYVLICKTTYVRYSWPELMQRTHCGWWPQPTAALLYGHNTRRGGSPPAGRTHILAGALPLSPCGKGRPL